MPHGGLHGPRADRTRGLSKAGRDDHGGPGTSGAEVIDDLDDGLRGHRDDAEVRLLGKGGDARMERQAFDRPALRIDELKPLAKAVMRFRATMAPTAFGRRLRPGRRTWKKASIASAGSREGQHQGFHRCGINRERDKIRKTGATGKGPVTPGSSLDVSAP